MKLSQKTITVLKNFNTINPSVAINEGSEIATMNQGRSIVGLAKVEEKFDKSFAIYELSRFLATYSLFNEPEIELGEKSLRIFTQNQSVTYAYCDPEFINRSNYYY